MRHYLSDDKRDACIILGLRETLDQCEIICGDEFY
jgi:hypothetical protein